MKPELAFYKAFPYLKERIHADPETLKHLGDWQTYMEDAMRLRDYFLMEMALPPSKYNKTITIGGIQLLSGRLRLFQVEQRIALFNRRGPNDVTYVDSIVLME